MRRLQTLMLAISVLVGVGSLAKAQEPMCDWPGMGKDSLLAGQPNLEFWKQGAC